MNKDNKEVLIIGAGPAGLTAAYELLQKANDIKPVIYEMDDCFGGIARTHDFLQRRYYEILSEMEDKSEISDADRKKYSAKLLLIYSEEPMTMRALDAIAYNKAVDATIADPSSQKAYRLKVTTWQRLTRNFFSYENTSFPTDVI